MRRPVCPDRKRLVLRQHQSKTPDGQSDYTRCTFHVKNDSSSMIVDWTISYLGKTPHVTAFRSEACTLVLTSPFRNPVSRHNIRYQNLAANVPSCSQPRNPRCPSPAQPPFPTSTICSLAKNSTNDFWYTYPPAGPQPTIAWSDCRPSTAGCDPTGHHPFLARRRRWGRISCDLLDSGAGENGDLALEEA
jgi:hypothetical protein